jgi:hypothetical protein
MRYVCICLLCVCLLVGVVDATDVVAPTDASVPPSGPAPTVPEVAIDDQSIQDIADALYPIVNPPTDPTVPTDPVVTDPPQVDLSPDAVDDIAGAVGAAVADAVAPDPTDAAPILYASGGIVGGYYFVADCALGQNIKFWVPADFSQGSITFDSSGGLVNMTNSTIYLMPDDTTLNSSYTIQAPRFSSFLYRRDASGYTWSDLDISNISDTNISWLDDTPQAVPQSSYFVLIASILVIGFLALFAFKRG